MFDDNLCPHCGLPFEPVEWYADLSGIGDDSPNRLIVPGADIECAFDYGVVAQSG